ncbi:YHYH protein [Algoriphagus sp. SE2]|uniref:YHYH protein n=1 Tax=Algoriphagus sp. SE2 TaxID=3141536 RepID=UPI0031CD426B
MAKNRIFKKAILMVFVVLLVSACSGLGKNGHQEKDEEQSVGERRPPERGGERPEGGRMQYESVPTASGEATPLSAFEEFNANSVTISFDGDFITIESTGFPNHTTPYWQETDSLYMKPLIAIAQTPGRIGSHRDRSLTLTVLAAPGLAIRSTATSLGPVGISVTGVPIFNDSEGPNRPLEEKIAETFDYAGGHVGPSGYHYHVESSDVPENTMLSHDDEKLVGIMADGFLIYGRKEMDGSYPSDLDVSGGHLGATQHSEGREFYHYHIINEYYLGDLIVLFGGDFMGSPTSIL